MAAVEVAIAGSLRVFDLSDLKPFSGGNQPSKPVAIDCPHCSTMGTFVGGAGAMMLHHLHTANGGGPFSVPLWYGMRLCPNPACASPVFLIEQDGTPLLSYPCITINFDASSVPAKIAASLRESIQCHAAGCFRGAALLARRTLEELCEDRGAKGGNLKDRISALGKLITVPKVLIEAMDEVRLLGNDAAHVEAKTYDDIGKDEVAIAIELCKELVKATYQYNDLVERMRGFKRT